MSDSGVTQDAAAKAPIEFTWKGRVLSKNDIARVFLLGSTVSLVLGVALNYFLTGGRVTFDGWKPVFGPAEWYTIRESYRFSEGAPQYLSWAPYDVFSGTVLVISLVLLGVGFLARPNWKHAVRAAGFSLFGFYWGSQAMKLYHSENQDFVNMTFAMFGVFFFNYFAYHELVSLKRREDPRALHWLTGTAFITTGVYFLTHKIEPIANWLILNVAQQTQWLLANVFQQGTIICGGDPQGSMIIYPMNGATQCAYDSLGNPIVYGHFPIQIILACTAIQSIMIFVGGIFALKPPRLGEGLSGKAEKFNELLPTYNRRRLLAFAITVPLIYVLNLFRNVLIIWMSGQQDPVFFASHELAFSISHNWIGKGGSLVALIIIAFIVFQILPELYDSIIGLLDLKERRGPLETWFAERFGRRGNGGIGKAPELAVPKPPTPQPEPRLD